MCIRDRSTREQSQPKPATNYVFGPLIDSPPAHPDTVLTTLLYVEKVIRQHAGTYTHAVADMQLYIVSYGGVRNMLNVPDRGQRL